MKLNAIIFSLILLPIVFMGKELQFSPGSSYNYISHLSKDIGPRTMGSPNESTALKWAITKYSGFGADSAYLMPFYESLAHGTKVNTQSGIAIAVFKGKTDSAIVIGGHIDSAGEEYPGANDDGSGSATVWELAGIWSQRSRHYTMVFMNLAFTVSMYPRHLI